jgi:hypothetical protein
MNQAKSEYDLVGLSNAMIRPSAMIIPFFFFAGFEIINFFFF